MATISVNTDDFVVLRNKLEKVHKNAFPNAAKGLINGLALDVKKRTLPYEGKNNFTNRNKGFFKSFSRVTFAKGRDLNNMESMVGMTDRGISTAKNAIDDMDKQERGGTIGGRSFVPLNTARVSSSYGRNVRRKNRVTSLSDVVNSNNATGKTKAERFIKSAIHAGVGGAVIGNFGKNIVWRINSIDLKSRKNKINGTPIYTYKQGRSVSVKATKFSQKAAKRTLTVAPNIWTKEAKRQLRFYSR